MFDELRKSLFITPSKGAIFKNVFDRETFKKEHQSTSENDCTVYTSTGNIFLDDFASLSGYIRKRNISDIFQTMCDLYKENPLLALKETGYLRLITRKSVLVDGTKLTTQRGQGLKFEYIIRLIWLAINHEDVFVKNMDAFFAIGSYKDFIEMMRYDAFYNTKAAFNWDIILEATKRWLNNDQTADLVKKYLPKIRCKRQCHTLREQANSIIGKAIAHKLYPTMAKEFAYNEYRKLKSSGKAHVWQKLITQGRYNEIDWSTVPGRALNKLVTGKFLNNHNLSASYMEWIDKQPVAKFTGYPYELLENNYCTVYQEKTINKQFMQLVKNAPATTEPFIVCLDTSFSMTSLVTKNYTALQIAVSMAIYFSYLLKGIFENTFLEFSKTTEIRKWCGDTPLDKVNNTKYSHACGNTDVLSVARLLVKLKKTYPNESFPTGALIISDGEFDYTRSRPPLEVFKNILATAFDKEFVDNFKLVLWDVRGGSPVFESLYDEPNYFYMGGLDPSGLAFLMNKGKNSPKTAEELFNAAMDQDLLDILCD